MKIFSDCRNPVLPLEYHIADPEAHVMPDGRVYVYGSQDKETDSYCSKDYRVISSENMRDWTDHGISFDSSSVSWVKDPQAERFPVVDWDFAHPTDGLLSVVQDIPVLGKLPASWKKMIFRKLIGKLDPGKSMKQTDILYAPDAIQKDGKYYLYFCMSDFSEGVAVSDRPEGPFEHPVQLRCGGIDPAVFIDEDGQGYYFWGQFNSYGAKLKENMTEIDESSIVGNVVTEKEHGFHEGSSIRKRKGIYYFVYPSIFRNGRPTALSYAMSRSPLGPYEYKGVIVDNACCDPKSWNIHGSIQEVDGQWYVFYHRSSGNSRYMRRMCVEPIFFNEDGTIREVVMTSQGAGRPFGMGEVMDGYRVCELHGDLYIEGSSLINIGNGDTAYFRYIEVDKATQNIEVSAEGSGTVSVYWGEKQVSRISIQDGVSGKAVAHGETGIHEMKLVFSDTKQLKIHSIVVK